MPHWIKAHLDDPDCPPMRTKRGGDIPRAPRSPQVKAVKYLRKRYKEQAGDMQPLAVACEIMDTSKRSRVRLAAAQLAHEITHGKLAPAQAVAAVQVNTQVVQAGSAEGEGREQLDSGSRARELAGLLKATAVLGDVCEGTSAGQARGDAGDAATGGAGQDQGGTRSGGGTGP